MGPISLVQKTSIHKRCSTLKDRDHGNPGHCGSGSDWKRSRENHGAGCGRGHGHGGDPCSESNEYRTLVASIAILSNSVNVMATHMGPGAAGGDNDDDAKPVADDKMKSNAHNSALTKSPKKEKE